MALRVESGALGCLPRYVDASGFLTDTPVFQSSAAWGTVFVGDREIVPSTLYQVRADVRAPLDPVNLSAPVNATTWLWGDTDNVNGVNLFDIICVLDGFQDSFVNCTAQAVDLQDAVPSRDVDLFDIVAVLDGFQSLPYPDGAPCGGGGFAAAEGEGRSLPLFLNVVSSRMAGGAERVTVEVFAEGVEALRGYQIALDLESRAPGSWKVEWAGVEEDRVDYVFGGRAGFAVGDSQGMRLANALPEGGVTTGERVYLGAFDIEVKAGAQGWLRVGLRPDQSFALNPQNIPIPVIADGDLLLHLPTIRTTKQSPR